jgi:hypothetical protein
LQVTHRQLLLLGEVLEEDVLARDQLLDRASTGIAAGRARREVGGAGRAFSPGSLEAALLTIAGPRFRAGGIACLTQVSATAAAPADPSRAWYLSLRWR